MVDSEQVLIPSKLKVVELREELKKRGLATTGLKNQLITRLEEALQGGINSYEEDVDDLNEQEETKETNTSLAIDTPSSQGSSIYTTPVTPIHFSLPPTTPIRTPFNIKSINAPHNFVSSSLSSLPSSSTSTSSSSVSEDSSFEVQRLVTELATARKEQSRLLFNLEQSDELLKTARQDARREIEELHERERLEFMKETESLKRKNEELVFKLSQKDTQIQTLVQEVKADTSTNSPSWKTRYEEEVRRKERAQFESDHLKEQADELRGNLSKMGAKVDTLLKERDTNKKERDKIAYVLVKEKEEKDAQLAQISKLETLIKEMNTKYKTLETKLYDEQKSHEKLRLRCEKERDEMMKECYKEKSVYLDNKATELDRLSRDLGEREKTLAKKMEDFVQIEILIEKKVQEEVILERRKLDTLNKQLEQQQLAQDKLDQSLVKRQKQIESDEKYIEQEREEIERERSDIKQERDKLNEEKEELDALRWNVEHENKKYREKHREAILKLEKIEAERTEERKQTESVICKLVLGKEKLNNGTYQTSTESTILSTSFESGDLTMSQLKPPQHPYPPISKKSNIFPIKNTSTLSQSASNVPNIRSPSPTPITTSSKESKESNKIRRASSFSHKSVKGEENAQPNVSTVSQGSTKLSNSTSSAIPAPPIPVKTKIPIRRGSSLLPKEIEAFKEVEEVQ